MLALASSRVMIAVARSGRIESVVSFVVRTFHAPSTRLNGFRVFIGFLGCSSGISLYTSISSNHMLTVRLSQSMSKLLGTRAASLGRKLHEHGGKAS